MAWAGTYRTTPRNIGAEPWMIPVALRQAIDDASCWVEHGSWPTDELAVRYAHRLVAVHPFPNGNGRWSRLAGDLMAIQLGGSRFTWGRTSLTTLSETRQAYVAALKVADTGDLMALLEFARS